VDKTVKLWDVRNPTIPLATLTGHQYAVRRVKCSPHAESVVYSASYDMTLRMWCVPSLSLPHPHAPHSAIHASLTVAVQRRTSCDS
jgi:WD40 repeat protein